MKTKSNSLKKALSIIVILLLLQQSNISAQVKLEYGFMYGPSNFLGDLGGNSGKGGTFLKDNMISLTRFMSGAYIGYSPFEFLISNSQLRLEKLMEQIALSPERVD